MRLFRQGYTLVEVLVVVIIIGILSTMGVAGMQRALANARIKDAAINTAAFVERVGNESNRLSQVLCLKIDPGKPQTIIVVKDTTTRDCTHPAAGIVDRFSIDPPSKFVAKSHGCPTIMRDWFSSSASDVNYVVFQPRLGLSAVPLEGGICIKYGDADIYGAVRKEKHLNHVVPMWKVGDDLTSNNNWSNWTEL